MVEVIDSFTWILIIIFAIGLVGFVALLLLPYLGINVKERIDKLLKQKEGIDEETSDMKRILTSEIDPPEIYDPLTKRSELVTELVLDNDGRIAMFGISDNGRRTYFGEVPNEDSFKVENMVELMKYVPGLKIRIERDSVVSNLKSELQSTKIKAEIAIAEKKNTAANTVTQITQANEVTSAAKKIAYGNYNPLNRPDQHGYGSGWRRPEIFRNEEIEE